MDTYTAMIIIAMWLHFMGDFIFQTNWQATNKSKNWWALSAHIFTYTLCLMILGPIYAIVNGLLHFVTDAVTSRISSKCYAKNDMKGFWMTIGADQFIHSTCLILTMGLAGWTY